MDLPVTVKLPGLFDHRFAHALLPVERSEFDGDIHVGQPGNDIGVARSPHGIAGIRHQEHDRRRGELQVEHVVRLARRLRRHIVTARARRIAHSGDDARPRIFDGSDLPLVRVHEKSVYLGRGQRNGFLLALTLLPRHREPVVAPHHGFPTRNGSQASRRAQYRYRPKTFSHRFRPPRSAPRPALQAVLHGALRPSFPKRDAPSPARSPRAERARNHAPA